MSCRKGSGTFSQADCSHKGPALKGLEKGEEVLVSGVYQSCARDNCHGVVDVSEVKVCD